MMMMMMMMMMTELSSCTGRRSAAFTNNGTSRILLSHYLRCLGLHVHGLIFLPSRIVCAVGMSIKEIFNPVEDLEKL